MELGVHLPQLDLGPVTFAAAMSALAAATDTRVVAGIGPGSSPADYAVASVRWEERWRASTRRPACCGRS